ncbi:MAG: hypothetical protein L0H83_02865 [Salinisphaera sp.]|nr:hypothetical protein [Nevskiaceae bacterium]MDN5937583.1 hypothetical protein [Salinisphaera sp.]
MKNFLLIAMAACLLAACGGQNGEDGATAATDVQAGEQAQADAKDRTLDMAAPAVGPPLPGACYYVAECPAGRAIAFQVDKKACAAKGGKSYRAEDGCTGV